VLSNYIQKTDAKAILKDVEGIGTVATRSAIIENLKKRGFLKTKSKTIMSSEQGRSFIALLPDSIKSAVTTAQWEQKLSQIEAGKLSLEDFTQAQIKYVESSVNAVSNVKIKADKSAVICPGCKEGVLSRRKGKYGFFWGCSRYSLGCKHVVKDVRGKSQLKQSTPAAAVTKDCPLEECDGTARQFNRKKGGGKLWVCESCNTAGRNKFYNDANGYPVVQR